MVHDQDLRTGDAIASLIVKALVMRAAFASQAIIAIAAISSHTADEVRNGSELSEPSSVVLTH